MKGRCVLLFVATLLSLENSLWAARIFDDRASLDKRAIPSTSQNVIEFLENVNRAGTELFNEVTKASWQYHTNITEANSIIDRRASVKLAAWSLKQSRVARNLKMDGLNPTQQRNLKAIRRNSMSQNKTIVEELVAVKAKLADIYNKAQVILDDGRALKVGQSGVIDFFAHTTDYDALKSVWKKWRDVSGKRMRSDYTKLVRLLNKGAKENGYRDYGYYEWFTDFQDPKFNEKVIKLLSDLHGLYKELHAYVRYKLSLKYPGRFDPKGPIPAHIFGNPWAQSWNNIFSIVRPYPNATSTDVTENMKRQNWTVLRLFKTAEEFFTSLGLPKMTKKFWERSVIERPKDNRPLDCHASAWDFFKNGDFRISMCTEINQEDFRTVHHEMGHIIYYMMYAHQPLSFRAGANSGFHEAIGDTISLSVSTAKHLYQIGLLDAVSDTEKAQINALMLMALEKIAFIPFGLTVDVWRWHVLNGSVSEANYNQAWWRFREDFQGLMPPVTRSETDFDPAAKYHVAQNIPYIRYFTSFIMQFQFYEAMCNASGHTGPLHTCDFYRSATAGDRMKRMLSLGSSKAWPEAMKAMTGQSEIRLDSLNKYFAPLEKWFAQQREALHYPIGWKLKTGVV